MSPEAWAFLSTDTGLIITGGTALLMTVLKTERRSKAAKESADHAADKAEEAAKNTYHVSNGFAASVDRRLDRLLNELATLKIEVDSHGRQLETLVDHNAKVWASD